jgi:hypothetical protein
MNKVFGQPDKKGVYITMYTPEHGLETGLA